MKQNCQESYTNETFCHTIMKMKDNTEIPHLLEQALAEWRKQQTLKRKSASLSQFAVFLGYSRPIVSLWMTEGNNRYPSKESIKTIAPKLAEILGLEVYDTLDIPRPDPDLQKINELWPQLPENAREKILKLGEKFAKDNESNKQKTSKTRPSETTP